MDEDLILDLVKAKIGISSNVRNLFLTHIIKGVIDELEKEKGIILDTEDSSHLMFVVDLSHFRYISKSETTPKDLQLRLRNLMISAGK